MRLAHRLPVHEEAAVGVAADPATNSDSRQSEMAGPVAQSPVTQSGDTWFADRGTDLMGKSDQPGGANSAAVSN